MRPAALRHAIAALAIAGAPALPSSAQEAAPCAATARPDEIFRGGEAAFQQGEFARAADCFELAFDAAPHPSALLNAADSRVRAGQLARAADLLERLRQLPTATEQDRADAGRLLADILPKVTRLEIADDHALTLALDGRPVKRGMSYVDPGDHTITATFAGEHKRGQRKIQAVAGALVVVKIAADPPQPKPEPPPLHPAWFAGGLIATAGLGAVTIWSGVDTMSAYDQYKLEETQDGLDDGLARQTRTNILIGATAAVGAATTLIAIFATDWESSWSVALAPTPDGLSGAARFRF